MNRNVRNRGAQAVLNAFLSQENVFHVPDDRGIVPNLLPNVPFDSVVFPEGARPLAFAVRSSKIKGNEKWSLTTHTYVALKKLIAIDEWLKRQSVPFDPYIVFVMEATRPEGPPLYHFEGKDYQLVAAPVRAYIANTEDRAASSWDKVQVGSAIFESIAIPLGHLLQRSRAAVA